MKDNGNFFLAILLSILILTGFHYFYEVPHQKQLEARAAATKIAEVKEEQIAAPRPRAEVVAEGKRVRISNGKLHGSINLKGARIDDITLATYHATTDNTSPEIVLLSPTGSAPPNMPYYAEAGWMAADESLKMPDAETAWTADKDHIGPGETVTLKWDNGQGLSFERRISLDDDYVFTVVQRVHNATGKDVTLYPFSLISRHGLPHTNAVSAVHEGPVGVLDGRLREHNYKKITEEGMVTEESTGGWLGMTDMYWLTAVIAPENEKISARFVHNKVKDQDRFQVDMKGEAIVIKAGDATEATTHVFTGAKEVSLLDKYEKDLHAPLFDRAIDFGWFYIFAKPFFHVIDFFYHVLGNYGLAIIAFTILLRLLFYPLQETTYRSMARMKELQPEMTRIKERYSADPLKMNEEMTALYKKENVNPLSGCWPIFIQIPVFFALYKVLLVSIEMRHAPFYGWVHDLSAPDPSNLFTLFGLIAWNPPSFLHLGVWPLLMGITMWIQQQLNPPPPDKTTQQVFQILPILFTFLFAGMSAGLVIYWTFSNMFAIGQQTLIKHRTKPKTK